MYIYRYICSLSIYINVLHIYFGLVWRCMRACIVISSLLSLFNFSLFLFIHPHSLKSPSSSLYLSMYIGVGGDRVRLRERKCDEEIKIRTKPVLDG